MLHPLFSQTRILSYYLFGWLAIAALQGLVLSELAHITLWATTIDTLIYNCWLLLLSLSFWFPLNYADKTQKSYMQLINNVIVFIVYLAIWLLGGWLLSDWILKNDTDYLTFSNHILPFRALWGGVLLLLISVLYHLLRFYQDLETKNREHEILQRLIKESELKALKSQLNPHFLFNSLNSISALTITDPDKAREMINKLSDFLRYSLRNEETSFLQLSDELKNMKRYLDIEKVRFGDRLNMEIDVDDQLLAMKVPAMILQPLYENAVKHGVYESIEPVNIRTYCRSNNDLLEISIINNYDPEAISPKGEGVGLMNVQNRLKTLFRSEGLFETFCENNQFEVTLLIPQTLPA
jgi:sensor histidine kinase YesM